MTKINEEACIGCGSCVSACPEGFEMVGTKAAIKNPKSKCIKEAIDICPVEAISN